MSRKRSFNDALLESVTSFTKTFDYSGTNLIFVGKTKLGTAKSEPFWQIKKFIYNGSSQLIDIQWPDGDDDFKYVWDNRVSYSYS